MVAFTQIRNPGTEGRIYFKRKVAEGKTKKFASLAQAPGLQRRVPPASSSTPDKRSGRTVGNDS